VVACTPVATRNAHEHLQPDWMSNPDQIETEERTSAMMNLIKRCARLCLYLGCCTAFLPAGGSEASDVFAGAPYRLRNARTGRVSSWDRTGDNRDFISFRPGETKELLSLDGPGALTHLYMTPAAPPAFLRTAVLRIFWDDERSPSVEAPLGDFFCAGDCSPRLFTSHYMVVNHGSGTIAYNAYFPMPFRGRARVTLENCGRERVEMFWYHIEYELYAQPLPADAAYFHAQWRREKPTRVRTEGAEAVPANQVNQTIWSATNRTGAGNYVILEAKGAGHVVGLYLTCHNLAGGWWGEGDDMIFIDGEGWPPSYHGTGTEEIFGGGACPNREYTGPYTGFVAIQEQGGNTWRGQNSMYRWFVHDPIRFQKSIRWTLEHGHANNFENDYSSVAYWYQTEPHHPFPPLPEDRLPSGGIVAAPSAPPIPGLVEAEGLLEKARQSGGQVVVVKPGAPYSRGEVALFRAREVGAWVSFSIPVRETGRLQIGGRFARASDLGQYRLLVDGKPLGARMDFYNGEGGASPTHVIPTDEVVFGTLELAAGEHELKFECMGKHNRSTGHFLAVDGFLLKTAK
jgi:hypothetical protein